MRRASLILFWATPVMAASKTKGASFRAGAAKAMGFVPSIPSAAKVGTMREPPVVMTSPSMS